MASYTIELRRLCEIYGRDEIKSWFTDYNIEEYLTPEQIEVIRAAGIWNKEKLAEKIIDHYYMREIGLETPALFKLRSKVLMQEIMEDYLPVIYSNAIKFDPLVNVDFTETFEREIEGTAQNTGVSNSESKSSSDGLSIENVTPQTNITRQNLDDGIYASNVSQSDSNNDIHDRSTTDSEGSSSSKEISKRHQKGNSGVTATAQALIKQYRETIRAVDREIIERLNVLFMGIY